MATFEQAVAELVQRHPEAEQGVSVTDPNNQYFARGQNRRYRLITEMISDPDVFVSTDDGRRMYVYYAGGGIYAGDKDWPEFENR